ncbi:MAG: hypothetical protein LIQ31_08590 [Planctomycetes bacterium]|nr:hypothetical protein [Planctomycetota bacterium]
MTAVHIPSQCFPNRRSDVTPENASRNDAIAASDTVTLCQTLMPDSR